MIPHCVVRLHTLYCLSSVSYLHFPLIDGTQGESISASVNDKLQIARRLSALGMDYIEAGWPGSNPKDCEFFERAQLELEEEVKSKLVAFGSTRRKKIAVEKDAQVQALIDSQTPTICIVAKSHAWHVTEILQTSLQENLNMIKDSVRYLVHEHGKRVMVDLEHYFDGPEEYALECARAAYEAGATCLVLCDTNGGNLPWQIAERVTKIRQELPHVTVGIHCHDDCGCAVANSLQAALAGVGLIQGTINGLGERTGNANLCSIIPSLSLKMSSSNEIDLVELQKSSRLVDEVLNQTPNSRAPFVGTSAFCHKGGLHVAAMRKSPQSYQHIDPALVGNEARMVVSELSGRQNILQRMSSRSDNADVATRVLDEIKHLESLGFSFEGADASVDLKIWRAMPLYCAPFAMLDYSVQVYQMENQNSTARATVKVRTEGDNVLQVADGQGPVDALAHALLRALPVPQGVELVDYKVRILDAASATAATTRVLVTFSYQGETWTTVSVDRNVITASLGALVEGFEYALVQYGDSCRLSNSG